MNKTVFALSAAPLLALSMQAALAQDKGAPPAASPPPAWHQGKPPAMAESKLAPHAPRMTETPAGEIPVDKLKLPAGFKAELWASGMPGARAMVFGDKGKLYVATWLIGRVYEVSEQGGKRSVRTAMEKLTWPSGLAFANGALYVMEVNRVQRFDGIEDNPAAKPVDLTDKFALPPERHHNWKYMRVGPDKKLYVPFGAPCNICEPAKEYAQIRRYNMDGSGMEVIATGVRNTQGFDWHPKTGELWFTDHGRDWLGDNGPEDELNRISKTGQNFGYPYCHANKIVDPDVAKGRKDACKDVTLPVATMRAHAAVMGIHFYTGSMFPKEYQGAAFIARKGSWNRSKKLGFDVVTVKADPDGKNAKLTPFLTGFLDAKADSFWGRPVYFAQMPDGALLVSDEQAGAIYRISYSAGGTKKK